MLFYLFIYYENRTQSTDKKKQKKEKLKLTRICAAEMAVRYAALCACRKVHT